MHLIELRREREREREIDTQCTSRSLLIEGIQLLLEYKNYTSPYNSLFQLPIPNPCKAWTSPLFRGRWMDFPYKFTFNGNYLNKNGTKHFDTSSKT